MPEQELEQKLALVLEGKKPLTELLGFDENQMGLLAELAHLYFQEGHYEEARTIFEGLLSLQPANPYYCRALGAVLQRLDQNDLAQRYYQRALKLDENEPETWANLGEVLLKMEQGDQAAGYLEKADQLFRARTPLAPQRRRVQAILNRLRRSRAPGR